MGVMNFEMRFFWLYHLYLVKKELGEGGNYASMQLILCSDCVQQVILVKQKKQYPTMYFNFSVNSL